MNPEHASRHILIVEDEVKLAHLLEDYLSHAGYRTSWLNDGAEVVSWIKAHAVDLILLDLMLPGKDGLAICREVRGFSSLPIIILESVVGRVEGYVHGGAEQGAFPCILQPRHLHI